MNWADYYEAKEQERVNEYCGTPFDVMSDEECKVIDEQIKNKLANEKYEADHPQYLKSGVYRKSGMKGLVVVTEDHQADYIPDVDGCLRPDLKWTFSLNVKSEDKMWQDLDIAFNAE